MHTSHMHADCSADLNGDNQVNVTDTPALLGNWGPCSCDEDLDQDGEVNVADLLILLGQWGVCPIQDGYNYSEALQKAIFFYACQRAGPLPETNQVQWRASSFLDTGQEQVGGNYDVDLTKRYMDAGDHDTYVLPITSAMTMLTWSAVQWGDAYNQTNQMDALKEAIRWHADWCIEAHPEPNVFCGQIGDGHVSHNFFGSPEIHPNYNPNAYWLTETNPGSEPTAEAAAFLAAASILFQDDDPAYSTLLRSHAAEL